MSATQLRCDPVPPLNARESALRKIAEGARLQAEGGRLTAEGIVELATLPSEPVSPMSPTEARLSADAAAKDVGVSAHTLSRLAKQHPEIRYRIGKRVFYDPAAVRAAMRRG